MEARPGGPPVPFRLLAPWVATALTFRAMKTHHEHRVTRTRPAGPCLGPVAERPLWNPRAWGGTHWRQSCRCGAQRDLLVNGEHDEMGPWVLPPAVVVDLPRKAS